MNIPELVTTFIKSEEQNRALQTYLNQLNQETDVMEETNRNLDGSIMRYRELVEMSEGDKMRKKEEMKNRVEYLKEEIMRANNDCEDIHGEYGHI